MSLRVKQIEEIKLPHRAGSPTCLIPLFGALSVMFMSQAAARVRSTTSQGVLEYTLQVYISGCSLVFLPDQFDSARGAFRLLRQRCCQLSWLQGNIAVHLLHSCAPGVLQCALLPEADIYLLLSLASCLCSTLLRDPLATGGLALKVCKTRALS